MKNIATGLVTSVLFLCSILLGSSLAFASAADNTALLAGNCVFALNTTKQDVVLTGSASIKMTNCKVQVNSNASNAVDISGSTVIKSTGNYVVGAVKKAGSASITPAAVSTTVKPDPFEGIAKPVPGACTYTNYTTSGNATVTLNPGTYCGGIKTTGNSNVTFNPGLYILKDGGLITSGNTTLKGNGVTFYMVGKNAGVTVGGSTNLTLVASSDGTLGGFLFFVDPASTNALTSSVFSGAANMNVAGIIYLPKQQLSLTGSSITSGPAHYTAYVADTFSISGSSNIITDATGIASSTPPPPPADTEAPVIAAHADIVATSTDPTTVTFTNPSASDNVDASVAVSCSPASGSVFAIGSTTVTCSAHDTAGNNATSTTFTVGVYTPAPPAPMPVVMASQSDDSFFCDFDNCFTGPASGTQATINLGQGSNLTTANLQTVTLERDPQFGFFPWIVVIQCFTDATYTTSCPDWVANTNGNGPNFIQRGTLASSTNPKVVTASFTDDRSFDGTSPVTFTPNYYYRLLINDNGGDMNAYGSESLQLPYYLIEGITQ